MNGTIDKKLAARIHDIIVRTAAPGLKKLGVGIYLNGGTINTTECVLKFKCKMETAEAAPTRADQERQQWEQHCGYIGLKPEHFGATFKGLDGATYRIIGIAPNRPKFPVIAPVRLVEVVG